MEFPARWARLALAACLGVAALAAQAAAAEKSQAQPYVAPQGTEDLIVEIRQADGDLLPGIATVRLTTRLAAEAEVTAAPQQEHRARFKKVPLGPIQIQVRSDSFVTADLRLLLENAGKELRLTVYLRPDSSPGQSKEGWYPALSASSASRYTRILDSLRKGDLKESQEQYAKLHRSSYGHPDVQYLAGVVDYRIRQTGMALFHFSQAAYLNPEFDDSARALGQLLYYNGIYPEAYQVFMGLARRRPADWESAWEAASAAFRAGQYAQARESAEAAYARGTRLAGKAELLVALADAMLNRWDEARDAATTFLTLANDPQMTLTAKDLLAAIGPAGAATDPLRRALPPERADVALLSAASFEPRLPPRLWAPPDVDSSAPSLLQGSSSCNPADVLRLAGQRVSARFDELRETTATEQIEQAVVDANGKIMPLKHFTVDYIADVHPFGEHYYAVDEYLAGSPPQPSENSPPVAHGMAALALVFYPPMQSDFVFKCEGLAQWDSRPAWSVYFTQRKDLPNRLRSYNSSGTFYPVYVRGRALVDQSTGEPLHIETDLQDPIPQIRLDEEHLLVDYRPVAFKNLDHQVYLPADAELYVHFKGRLFRIRHHFEKYLRFTIATQQRIKGPKIPPPEDAEPKPEKP